jgi:hypothetical protein
MRQAFPERNNELFAKIDHCAQASLPEWFPDAAGHSLQAQRGPVEFDYLSISYKLAFAQHSVFIKIPKMKWYETDISSILLDPSSRQSAQTEFDGFTRIHSIKNWPDGCSTVRPLAYIEEFNALCTEFTPSQDLFRQCRKAGPQLFPLSASSQRVHASLRRCGEWLKHFQGSQETPAQINVSSRQLLEDILGWTAEIEGLCICPRQLRALLGRLEQNSWSQEMPRFRSCEGFEVRNIIVDEGGTVRLVDPGNLSLSSGLEDVAHFLVSLTMLYWGTPMLWMGIPVAQPYRRSFMEGWMQNSPGVSPSILAWFETRELFRQWLEAYKVLEIKPYPHILRKFLRFAYVDAFFLNRIKHNVELACSQKAGAACARQREEI